MSEIFSDECIFVLSENVEIMFYDGFFLFVDKNNMVILCIFKFEELVYYGLKFVDLCVE